MKTKTVLDTARAQRTAADARRAEINAAIAALKADMAVLERQLDEVPELWAIDDMKALRGEIAARMPEETVELLGPHGIDCLLSIHVGRGASTMASVTFRPDGDGGYRVVDYTRNTGEYPKNTMGERAGANHPDVAMPDDVEEIVAMLRASMERRAA
jgi:hypothetical protein